MKTSWQDLIKHLHGHMTAGEAVVRINRKHVSLGKLKRGIFAWTPAGLALSETFMPPIAAPASSGSSEPTVPVAPKKRRTRRTKAQIIADANAELQSHADAEDPKL